MFGLEARASEVAVFGLAGIAGRGVDGLESCGLAPGAIACRVLRGDVDRPRRIPTFQKNWA